MIKINGFNHLTTVEKFIVTACYINILLFVIYLANNFKDLVKTTESQNYIYVSLLFIVFLFFRAKFFIESGIYRGYKQLHEQDKTNIDADTLSIIKYEKDAEKSKLYIHKNKKTDAVIFIATSIGILVFLFTR